MAEGSTDLSMTETERNPIHSSLYSHHSKTEVEGVSVEVCNKMNLLGYGEEIRRRRVEKFRKWDMMMNAISHTVISAGSKAEGLTCASESDYDMLFLLNNVLCVEAGVDLHTIADDIEVYRMDTRVYPGHCRMLLERPASTRFQEIINALCYDEKGNAVLSSSFFLDEMSNLRIEGVPLGRAGPSLPHTTASGRQLDIVSAVRCHCPGILQRWAQRSRHWPPPDVVEKVVSLGSVVTPVGFKGSEYNFLEWRICFNMGETELIHNLNVTQAQLYVILKMVAKEVLKPKNKEITSYVLKNIILWQAESNSPAIFQERNLIHWLHDALGTLRSVISCKQLPYYMIPVRNLMAACGLHDEQQCQWIANIGDLMEEGPRVILRLPKIRQAVICHPDPLLWFSRSRMEMEMLQLEWTNRCVQHRDENGDYARSDIIMQEIMGRMAALLITRLTYITDL